MKTTVIYDNEYVSLFYYPEKGIVHHRLYHKLDSKHLREVLTRGTELLLDYGATKWLSDNRDIDAHSPEDTAWINEVWLPGAIAAGWKYWALVIPYDNMAKMNMSEFIESFYNVGVRVMVFVDVDEAMQWLETVDR